MTIKTNLPLKEADIDLLETICIHCSYSQRKEFIKMFRIAANKEEAKVALRMCLTADWYRSHFYTVGGRVVLRDLSWDLIAEFLWKRWHKRNLQNVIYVGCVKGSSRISNTKFFTYISDDPYDFDVWRHSMRGLNRLYDGSFIAEDKELVRSRAFEICDAIKGLDDRDFNNVKVSIGNITYSSSSVRPAYVHERFS